MNAKEFLEMILPSTGFIFTATQSGSGGWINTCHTTIDSAVAHVNELTFQNKQAYFALARYEKDKVWDGAWKDAAGAVVGKWRTRTQANAQSVKSLFLDLDVNPDDPAKFPSKTQAAQELKAFVQKVGLPKPAIVDSGGGLHAYWPLASDSIALDWRPVADKFKQVCIQENFKADRSLTSDQARVLRCLGGYNFRRGAPVQLLAESNGPYDFSIFEPLFDSYLGTSDGAGLVRLPALPGTDLGFSDNLGATNNPSNFDQIVFSCAQLGSQVAARGAGTGEQLWRAALGIVKFCEPQAPAYRAVSDGHAEYNEQSTIIKIQNWRAGPTACKHFHTENPKTCEKCQHWEKITSPIQLGKMVQAAPPVPVTVVDELGIETQEMLPSPPYPYKRSKTGAVVMQSEDDGGKTEFVEVSPYDIYPIKILRQNSDELHVAERAVWRAHLPRLAPLDMDIPQVMLSDTRKLYGHLLSKGVYMSNEHAKSTQHYMSAYLQALAAAAEREKLYERLGWHNNHSAFVMGDYVLYRDGSKSNHLPGRNIKQVTKEALKAVGTLDGWKQAMQFYNKPGFEGHRFFIYAALAAPLFHMTSHKGATMTASGESGRGKTTCLMACASLWGEPEALMLNGNKDGSTYNKLYDMLGTFHSLPFLIDDTTERDPEEIRRMVLNMPQGKGKERLTEGAEPRTWETIALTSANTDDISRIMASAKDVGQSLMRLVSVEFNLVDTSTEAKIAADQFLRQMRANYGHVGPAMMRVVIQNYDKIKAGVEKNMEKVDRLCGSKDASAERFWTAVVAAAYTAAQLASKMQLLDFPFEEDLKWMVKHLDEQRDAINQGHSTPQEILAEFLDKHQHNTLILSAKHTSNLDNVALRPTQALLVRHELDNGVIYISRPAIVEYCAEIRTPFNKLEKSLEAAGVLLSKNAQKVLGADSPYAKGQCRAWKVDVSKIGGHLPALSLVPQSVIASIGAVVK